MTQFELRVLELLTDWWDDPLNITGLNSCDALIALRLELLKKRSGRAKETPDAKR